MIMIIIVIINNPQNKTNHITVTSVVFIICIPFLGGGRIFSSLPSSPVTLLEVVQTTRAR